MVITLLAPEYVFGRAVVNLRSCLFHTTQLADLAYQDGVPWYRYHTCLADLGDFVLTFPQQPAGEQGQKSELGMDCGDANTDEKARKEPKAPSLPHVAVIPLSPIRLEPIPSTSPGGHRSNSPMPSPDHRCSHHSFGRQTIDVEAERAVSPASISRPSRASSNSSSDSDSQFPSATDTIAACSTASAETWYEGESIPGAFISGKDWGEALICRRRTLYIDRETRRYGPIMWRPHPTLVALSKRLITFVTDTNNADSTTRQLPSLPPGMNKCHLVRSLIALEGDTAPLCAAQLLEARRMGLVSRLPYLTEPMVRDRDKGDTLVKLAAVWQTV